MKKKYSQLELLAMSIVNNINEINSVTLEIRQKNNDVCFDDTYKIIERFLYVNNLK